MSQKRKTLIIYFIVGIVITTATLITAITIGLLEYTLIQYLQEKPISSRLICITIELTISIVVISAWSYMIKQEGKSISVSTFGLIKDADVVTFSFQVFLPLIVVLFTMHISCSGRLGEIIKTLESPNVIFGIFFIVISIAFGRLGNEALNYWGLYDCFLKAIIRLSQMVIILVAIDMLLFEGKAQLELISRFFG